MSRHAAKWWGMTTVVDRLLIGFFALVTLASIAVPFTGSGGERYAVEIDGDVCYAAALDEERQITLPGYRGRIVIASGPHGVRVVHSECPEQLCVKLGWRSHTNDVIVCVPNKMVITIYGKKPNNLGPLDAITR